MVRFLLKFRHRFDPAALRRQGRLPVFLRPSSDSGTRAQPFEQTTLTDGFHDLAIAGAAAVTDPRFRENVEALKSVQPVDLPATEIDVRLRPGCRRRMSANSFTNC